jgi:hypothetical protein
MTPDTSTQAVEAMAICIAGFKNYTPEEGPDEYWKKVHPDRKVAYCREATAAIRALLDVPVSEEMADVGAEFTEGDYTAARFAWNDMLAQLVKEVEGEKK